MIKHRKRLISVFILFLTLLPFRTSVLADDYHEHKDDKKENYQKSDDDHDEREAELQRPTIIHQQPEYWNIWSREARNNPNSTLPITAPSQLTAFVDNKETSIYFIPQDGQLLVSAEAIASALGTKSHYYPQSKICTLTKDNHELIVRVGYNAVFENHVKTPIPTEARSIEKTVYLPVSVAANALGYRVTWDENKKALVIQAI